MIPVSQYLFDCVHTVCQPRETRLDVNYGFRYSSPIKVNFSCCCCGLIININNYYVFTYIVKVQIPRPLSTVTHLVNQMAFQSGCSVERCSPQFASGCVIFHLYLTCFADYGVAVCFLSHRLTEITKLSNVAS